MLGGACESNLITGLTHGPEPHSLTAGKQAIKLSKLLERKGPHSIPPPGLLTPIYIEMYFGYKMLGDLCSFIRFGILSVSGSAVTR